MSKVLKPHGEREERAIAYMRRFTELVMRAASGDDSFDPNEELRELEAEAGMTHQEAVETLQERLTYH